MKIKRLRGYLSGKWQPFAAIIAALVVGWLILLLANYDAPLAFSALWDASFGSLKKFGDTINKASPLLFTGLAVAISYRASVFNIGAEGQFLLGATLSSWVGFTFTSLPAYILIPLMIVAGAIGGALWAFIPGLLKARHGVSEVITTIMFNYIALHLVGFLVRGPFQDTAQAEPQSFNIAPQGYLSVILPGTRMHFGFLLGIVLAFALFFFLFKTFFGYEIRAVGLSPLAAKVGGIKVTKTMVTTMLISGALAGVGGAIEIAGSARYLLEGISPGYGYTAIAVSVLAANHPIGVIFTSFLFGMLNAGATAMQRIADVSSDFVDIFQGMIILFIAVATVSGGKRLKGRRVKEKEPALIESENDERNKN